MAAEPDVLVELENDMWVRSSLSDKGGNVTRFQFDLAGFRRSNRSSLCMGKERVVPRKLCDGWRSSHRLSSA